MSMTRRPARLLLAALFLCMLLGGFAYATGGGRPVYDVREVVRGLRRQPHAWVGRTVLIWALDVRGPAGCRAGPTHAAATRCRPRVIEWLAAPVQPAAVAPQAGWTSYPPVVPRRAADDLVVMRRPRARIPVATAPNDLLLRLAQVPVVGALVPPRLRQRGALYHVLLLGPARCMSPPCPRGILQ